MSHRPSGEIINATLLEIFLALVFLVFGLASFEHRRGGAAADSVAALKSSLDAANGRAAKAEQAAKELKIVVDSLRTAGNLWPNCTPNEMPPELVTITLEASDVLLVTFNKPKFGWVKGQEVIVSAREFSSRFSGIRAAGESAKCRYSARVLDTEATTKGDYKRLLRVIRTTFRLGEFLS